MKKKFEIKIEYEYCKGCELCIFYCPQKVLRLSEKINRLGYKFCEVVDIERCTGCGRCYLMCPDYIIEVLER